MANSNQNPFKNVWEVLNYLANNFTLFAPVRDLVSKLNTKVEGYETLLNEKADDIEYENNKVYLTSYGERIGDGMTLPDNGLSAYQIWLNNGHRGTEQDFLNSLKGEKGTKGEDGKSFSIQGQKDSVDALPPSGQVGEGWLVQGNVYIWDITANKWINGGSLKGEKGDPGERGPQGSQGPRGEAGQRGQQGPAGQTGARGETGIRGSKTYTGNAITGNSTTPTVFTNTGISDALVNDLYININNGNSNLGNVYICTRAGNASTALWKYECNIVGARGVQGERGPQGPAGQNGSKGDKGDPGLTDEERRKLEETIKDLIDRIENLENSNDVRVESITIKNKLSMMGTGEGHTLEYVIKPDNATNKQVEMISSNPSVASITNSGVIECLTPGETQITVRSKRYTTVSDSYSLQVSRGYVSVRGMALNNVPTELPIGNTANLSVTFTPDNATNKNVTFRSSNPNVLTVDTKTGKITAKSIGFAQITATSEAAPFITVTSRSIQVVSRHAERGIAIGAPISSLRVYKTHNLELSVINNYPGGPSSFICDSSDKLVATIDDNGVLMACGRVGTTTITIYLADNPSVSTSFVLDTYLIAPGVEEITIACGTEYTVPRNEDLYIPYTAPISLAGYSFFAYENKTDEIIGTGYVDHGYMILRATNLTRSSKYRLYFLIAKYIINDGYTPIAHSNIITVNITDPVNAPSDNFNITTQIERLLVGRTHKITAAYSQGAHYISDTPNVATVENDVIRAVNNGRAIIRGIKEPYTSKMQFNVECDAGISITNRISCLKIGQSMQITYKEYGSYNRGVSYSSSNNSIATVDENGLIVARGIGRVDIYLTSKYNAAIRELMTIEVIGSETPAKHIIISNRIKAIRVGTSYKLEALPIPATNLDTITFSSSEPSVLYVDRFGTMVGKSRGIAQVSVISANYRETYDVMVYDVDQDKGVKEVYISTLTGEDMYASNGRLEFSYVTVSLANFHGAEIRDGYSSLVLASGGKVTNNKIIFNVLPRENIIGARLIIKDQYGNIAGQSALFNLYVR